MSSNAHSASFTVFKGSPGGKIVQDTTHRVLDDNSVLVKITHSGLCFTDVHFREQNMVLGHEGVGIVERVGAGCKDLKSGDRVGWGYVQDTCGTCDMCFQGEDMYCPHAALYGMANLDIDSFASHAVIKESFLIRVPEQLNLLHAGPLFCGGATVFEALNRYGVKSTDRVGVIGVGGLGHLAVQFAAKMGCEVVIFSSTESKREEALGLGATEFHAVKGAEKLDNVKPVNCLLSTANAQPDWKLYLDIMAPKGIIFPLTVELRNYESFPALPVNIKGITVQGSCVGSRSLTRRMLDFAARHGVKPIVQTFPMTKEGIEEAIKVLQEGKMRYRGMRPLDMLRSLLLTSLVWAMSVAAHSHGGGNGMDMSMDVPIELTSGTMVPYLHFNISWGDILWFYGWVPKHAGPMFAACLGLFLLGILERWLAMLRVLCEFGWSLPMPAAEPPKGQLPSQSAPPTRPRSRFIPSIDLPRGLLQVFQSAIGFAFMLAVMTWQVGFILSICIGLGVGEMLFGRIISAVGRAKIASC
ncbi:hypothetical protein FB107DRAFT_205183 [Schizophyllum commune]